MTYPVSKRSELFVEDGERVEPGKQLVEGPLDPKEVLEVLGTTAVQKYLVKGVQEVYNSQGVPIHDKHIEVIVRQMLRKVTINDSGETEMLRVSSLTASASRPRTARRFRTVSARPRVVPR